MFPDGTLAVTAAAGDAYRPQVVESIATGTRC